MDEHDCHIFCALCLVLSLLLIWTVLLEPYQDLWLCDLLSDGWHERPLNVVVEALAPNIIVRFPFLHYGTSLHNSLTTCLQFVQLQLNFCQSLTGYIARWLELSNYWFDYMEFPFEFADSNSTHMPSSFASLFFPDCCKSLMRYPFLFCDLMHPIIFLSTSSRTLLVPFPRSPVVTSGC